MIDEKALYYLKDRDSVPECEVIEADGRQHRVKPHKRKTHSIFRALLFPANLTGLAHIAIFTVCFLSLTWVRFVSLGYVCYAVGFINLLVTIEMICYFYHCVRESADGASSAPDSLLMDGPDMTGVSATLGGLNLLDIQYMTMILPFLICFLPAMLYPYFTDRVDGIFWVLLAAGTFYFPMFFLAVILFDSSSGYNPLIHVISIIKTFFSYCVLVFQCAVVIVLICLSAIFLSRNHTMAGLLTLPITLYITMVYLHLMGRYFYKNEEKLCWAV